MRVHIEKNFASLKYEIWAFDDASNHVLAFDNFGHEMWVNFQPGTRPDPSIKFDPDLFEAILQEAMKVIPASHATERHLLDVISTRDRLLTLVEKHWNEND